MKKKRNPQFFFLLLKGSIKLRTHRVGPRLTSNKKEGLRRKNTQQGGKGKKEKGSVPIDTQGVQGRNFPPFFSRSNATERPGTVSILPDRWSDFHPRKFLPKILQFISYSR